MEMTTLGANCVAVRNGNEVTLMSYDTEILVYDTSKREIVKVTDAWDYSRTTSKHIGMFANEYGIPGIATKAEREKLFKEKGLI